MERKQNSKIIGKKYKILDYRIIAYQQLLKCIKRCKIFQIQKIVKIIKQLKEIIEKCEQENTKEKNIKKISKYDKKLQYLKTLGKEDLKIMTCYMLITQFSLDLEKAIEFFNKEIKNFQEKLSNFQANKNIEDSNSCMCPEQIIEKIIESKQYKQEKFNLDNLLQRVKQKSKSTIERRKAKKKRKIAQKQGLVQEIPEKSKERFQKKNQFQNNFPQQQINKFQKEKEPIKQPEIPTNKFPRNINNEKPKEAINKFLPQTTQLHPSLIASIQRKREQKNAVFSGKKLKLS